MIQALLEVSSRGYRGPRLRWGHTLGDLVSQHAITQTEDVGVSRSTSNQSSSKKGWVEVLEWSRPKTHLKKRAQGTQQFWMVSHGRACPLCTEPTQEALRRGREWWTQVAKHSPYKEGTRGPRLRGGRLQMVLNDRVSHYAEQTEQVPFRPILTSILKLTDSWLWVT